MSNLWIWLTVVSTQSLTEATMSILKRGNSKYWYIQFQLRGKTYIRSSRTTSKKIAEQMESEWKSKLHAHQYRGEKPRISMGEAIQQFCDTKKGTPNHRNLRSHYAVICKFFSTAKFIDELTVHDLERFKRHRELTCSPPALPI